MGLTVKTIKLSKGDQEIIDQAKIQAKSLREMCIGEEFPDEITKEDDEYMLKVRIELSKQK